MQEIKLIAFTHKTIGIENLGLLHIEDDLIPSRLQVIKQAEGVSEVMMISTCNRIEFVVVSTLSISQLIQLLMDQLYRQLDSEIRDEIVAKALLVEGIHAVKHLFKVASSLDSLVIGEREIITQVRSAYDRCQQAGLTGDTLRLVIKKTIETAKQVYTETEIANRPVSVVNLAYRMLRQHHITASTRVLLIGAGKTNAAMAQQLAKHKIGKLTIFNRTLSKAQALAVEVNGEALPLTDLYHYQQGFDVIVTCTGSSDKIITPSIYSTLLNGETAKKIVVDLAVPGDFDETICQNSDVDYISITALKSIAEKNLSERHREVAKCESIIDSNIESFELIYRTRMIELAMMSVPTAVKQIKQTAVSEVFAKDLTNLDDNAKAVLDKVIDYMEKKYISMPMRMAREIMLGELSKK